MDKGTELDRIRGLEAKLRKVRSSRMVLMDVLALQDRLHREERNRLLSEIYRLRRLQGSGASETS